MKKNSKLIVENLGYFSEGKAITCANFSISQGETILMLGNSNIALLKKILLTRKHFFGNFFYQNAKGINNLLQTRKCLKNKIAFFDNQYFQNLDNDQLPLQEILVQSSKVKATYNLDFRFWNEKTRVHKEAFRTQFFSFETEAFQKIINTLKISQKFLKTFNQENLQNIQDTKSFTNLFLNLNQALKTLIEFFHNSIISNFDFFENINNYTDAAEKSNAEENIKSLERLVERTRVSQAFNTKYLDKQKHLKLLREEISTLKKEQKESLKNNKSDYQTWIKNKKNSAQYFQKLFDAKKNFEDAKTAALYRKAFRKLKYNWRHIHFLKSYEKNDFLQNFNDYLTSFRKNLLYSNPRRQLHKSWINNRLRKHFRFQVRSYLATNKINKNNYRKNLWRLRWQFWYLKFSYESKEPNTLKSNYLETLEYDLHNARIDLLWKKNAVALVDDVKNIEHKFNHKSLEKIVKKLVLTTKKIKHLILQKFPEFKMSSFRKEDLIKETLEIHNLLSSFNSLVLILQRIFKLAMKVKILFGFDETIEIKKNLQDFFNYQCWINNSQILKFPFHNFLKPLKELMERRIFQLNLLAMQFSNPFLLIFEKISNYHLIQNQDYALLKKIINTNQQALIYQDFQTNKLSTYSDYLHISFENALIEYGTPREVITEPLHLLTYFIINNYEIPKKASLLIQKNTAFKESYFYNPNHKVIVSAEQLTSWREFWDKKLRHSLAYLEKQEDNPWQTKLITSPITLNSPPTKAQANLDIDDTVIVDL